MCDEKKECAIKKKKKWSSHEGNATVRPSSKKHHLTAHVEEKHGARGACTTQGCQNPADIRKVRCYQKEGKNLSSSIKR